MFSKKLLLVALFLFILAVATNAAPANSSVHSPQWEKACQKRLRSFVFYVCGTLQCESDVTSIGCERKLTEAEMKEICCPDF